MNRIITALLLVALSFAVSAEVWQARYGVAETFDFKLYNADGTLDIDEADGGTEVSLSCNEGAETTATNDFVDEGTFYSIALTASEMQCERIAVVVAATTTEVFFIQTIDNTSAMTPMIVQTGDSFARLGAPAGASVSADVLAIDNFVDDLESRLGTPSNLGGGATVAANLSDIEGQTDDIGTAGAGLTNIDLPNQTMDITGTISTVTSVTNTVTANATQFSGDSAVVDRLEAILDGTCGSYPELGITRGVGCTAQAYTAGTPSLTLDASAAFGDNTLTGATILICGSTQGYCQPATAASNVGSTDVVTLSAALPVAATGTITYTIFGTASGGGDVNVTTIEGTDATTVLGTAQTGDAYARLGAPAGASVSADIAAVKSDSAAILVDTSTTLDDLVDDLESRLGTPVGASISADIAGVESGISWNAAWDAEVQSEANDAIVANLLDRLLLNTYDPASPPGAADSLLEDLVESDAGVTRFSVNALEQAPSGGGGVADWSADERTAIRSILGIPASGTTPDDPTVGILDTTRDAVAGVQSDTNDIQTRLPAALVSGRMDSSTGAMAANVMTAAAAAADLTTELQSGLATSSAVTSLDTKLGTPAGASVSADVAAVKSDSAAILVDTAEIGVAGAGLTAADDAVLAAIAALNNVSIAQIRDMVIEDMGGGVSLGCKEAIDLAFAAGDITTSGGTTTWRDPSNGEVRIVSTVTSNGNRTSVITCPTY
jgi:hypothetical protein